MQQYKEEILRDLSSLDKLALLVPGINDRDISLHLNLIGDGKLENSGLEEGAEWLSKLIKRNGEIKRYDPISLLDLFEDLLTVAAVRQNIGTELMPPMSRTALINTLIVKFGYNSYVEIGVNDPCSNFDQIKCANKQGIDPVPLRADIIGSTSDDYFEPLNLQYKFDLIFIDGLHQYEQVVRDINNSLDHLTPEGTIVCHDMLPKNEEMQRVPRETGEWTGDCWKAWAHFRMSNKNLDMKVVNTDYGLGIIRRGRQKVFSSSVSVGEMTYAFFNHHKQDLMNIIDVNTFIKSLNLSYRDIFKVLQVMNVLPVLKEKITGMLNKWTTI